MSSFHARASALFAAASLSLIAGCGSKDATGPDKTVSLIEVSPRSARMYVVGDSASFSAVLTTEAGTDGAGIPIGWISRDPTLVQVNSKGVAKSLKKGGSTYVVAKAGDKADSALVEVLQSPCGSTAATNMAIGDVVTATSATGFCVAGQSGSEYVALALNTALTSASSSSFEIVGQALGAQSEAPAMNSLATRLRIAGNGSADLQVPRRIDHSNEIRLRAAEKATLTPLVESAQRWYKSRSMSALRAAAPPAVGDLVSVNVNMGSGCSSITLRNARVAAVSGLAIMLDDTANPSGGFTDAEYASLAATFDTLISPVDLANFGAPTDLDANSRVIILTTRAINELTPTNSSSFIGGRTMTRDLFPKTGPAASSGTTPQGCAASNQGEIFYMLAPDPAGTVNSNVFSKAFVLSQSPTTIAHEYQHMINFARRMYIDGFTADKWFDEIWLHEGLSHMAEELVFHKASNLSTRANLGLNELISSNVTVNAFNSYMAGDFFLYDGYTANPAQTSPFRQVDDINTRGATWSFLRFAVDQLQLTDGNLWYNLVNSGQIGMTNLQAQLGLNDASTQSLMRDFAVSLYADDMVIVPAKYLQKSWNMRSIYPGYGDPSFHYSLPVVKLTDNTVSSGTVVASGAKYYDFKGLAGTDSFIRLTGPSAGALPAGMSLTVIRIR